MNLFFSFLVSVSICIAIIPILIRYAGSLNMLDQPGDRKVHTVAIPRCGGLALAISSVISILIFIPNNAEFIGLVVGSLVIVFFGLLDDLFELNYKWKFVGQFTAVFVVILDGIYLSYMPFTDIEPSALYFALPLTLAFVVGVTNAVNLSDGLDGLAAGIMFMSLAVISYLSMEVNGVALAIIALAVAGGIVGFLWFNTYPAIVFMGDAGSQFIGFISVFLAIYLTQNVNQVLNPALPLLLLGLPILDTITVMFRRIRAGKSPFLPDKTHIHHKLMQHGFSHAGSVATIYIIQGIYLAFALLLKYESDIVVFGTFLTISTIILLLFYWATYIKWSLHTSSTEQSRRGRNIWRNDKLFKFCSNYINISIGLFLVSQWSCLLDRFMDISSGMYLLVFCGLVFFYFLPQAVQNIWVRFSVYIAAIFSNLMTDDFPEIIVHTHWAIDVYLLVLAGIVSIAIRITRKTKFRMTTQDLLVMLVVIASVLLVETQYIESLVFRLFCLVYALEYLLQREIYKFRLTRYTAAVHGFLILAIVMPTIS